ncbi:hypothetical protein SLEP1_g2483 [Rubroshorea leprosula]|uniref:Uncharacterized protein n=1 Tax=Rubroshorea leprosula TaxID=152421 RepID=A0AAV5HR32_9ROSI|nr:hypothetical protein SLEP1_g2483 [Rubroshorea leprosula]
MSSTLGPSSPPPSSPSTSSSPPFSYNPQLSSPHISSPQPTSSPPTTSTTSSLRELPQTMSPASVVVVPPKSDVFISDSILQETVQPVVSSHNSRRTHSMVTRSQDGTRKVRTLLSMVTAVSDIQEPHTFKQAQQSHWRHAMEDEYSTLLRNKT